MVHVEKEKHEGIFDTKRLMVILLAIMTLQIVQIGEMLFKHFVK
jgi:hypothetical protein